MSYPFQDIKFVKNEPDPHSFSRVRRAAHACLHAKSEKVLFDYIPMQHSVMMQLRFDGLFGFPGGYVEGESTVVGLNRELNEEIGLKDKYFFNEDDYFGTWIHKKVDHTLLASFYVKEFSERDFEKIEKHAIGCKQWGTETMGLVRVPLHEAKSMSKFLQNKFVGNARDQLVEVLLSRQLMPSIEFELAWSMVENKPNKTS